MTASSTSGLSPDYPIRTKRLLLRPWRNSEVDTYLELKRDPKLIRYLYDEPLVAEEAPARLASLRSTLTAPGQWINVAVEVTSTGAVAGDVGLGWISDVHRRVDIGYTFFATHHAQGYATEAASAMVDLAFTDVGAHRVAGHIDARNTASARVLERLGMRREAHLVENEWVKGEWTDEAIYGILDVEWSTRRSS